MNQRDALSPGPPEWTLSADDIHRRPPPRLPNPITTSEITNFGAIARAEGFVWPPSSDRVNLTAGLLKQLFRLIAQNLPFDEAYYLLNNPDVKEAIESGSFASARDHYVEFGFFEDRLPFAVSVDEDFYFLRNPDVKQKVIEGVFPSAQVHFEQFGFQEGRLPREGWSLLRG